MTLRRITLVLALAITLPGLAQAQGTVESDSTVTLPESWSGGTPGCPTCLTTPAEEGDFVLNFYQSSTGQTNSTSGTYPVGARVRYAYLSAVSGSDNILVNQLKLNLDLLLGWVGTNWFFRDATNPIPYASPGPLVFSTWQLFSTIQLVDYNPWNLSVSVTLHWYLPPVVPPPPPLPPLPPYRVGVIPEGGTCPGGAPSLAIHMDDEDGRNANGRAGWIGATSSTANTTFHFCPVEDGTVFKPVSAASGAAYDYAVLKLGANCPPGSIEFSRYFDNEDSGTANWSSGDIRPNASTANTRLFFCLFSGGATTMSTFPYIGGAYGVFAGATFSKAMATGWIRTDDEDYRNTNSFTAPASIYGAAAAIVNPGANTRLNMAKVR